jgi:hypothetical protein
LNVKALKRLDRQGKLPKRISVELTDEQHKRFVNAKLDRGARSLQELMIAATDELLSRRPRSDRSTSTGELEFGSDPNRARSHALLDYIIDNDSKDDQTSIQKILEWGANNVGGGVRETQEIACPVCQSNLQIADPENPVVIEAKGFHGVPADLVSLVAAFVRLMRDETLGPALLLVRQAIKETLATYCKVDRRKTI